MRQVPRRDRVHALLVVADLHHFRIERKSKRLYQFRSVEIHLGLMGVVLNIKKAFCINAQCRWYGSSARKSGIPSEYGRNLLLCVTWVSLKIRKNCLLTILTIPGYESSSSVAAICCRSGPLSLSCHYPDISPGK